MSAIARPMRFPAPVTSAARGMLMLLSPCGRGRGPRRRRGKVRGLLEAGMRWQERRSGLRQPPHPPTPSARVPPSPARGEGTQVTSPPRPSPARGEGAHRASPDAPSPAPALLLAAGAHFGFGERLGGGAGAAALRAAGDRRASLRRGQAEIELLEAADLVAQ